MNRPLTKEERETILSELENYCELRDCQGFIERLLESEAYWREAVKNAVPIATKENLGHCALCGGDHANGKDHEDSCPWKAAAQDFLKFS